MVVPLDDVPSIIYNRQLAEKIRTPISDAPTASRSRDQSWKPLYLRTVAIGIC